MSLDKYQLQWIIWELVLHFIWGTLDWHNTSKQCWEPDHRDQKARKFVILGVGRPPSVPFWFVPQENEFHNQAGLARGGSQTRQSSRKSHASALSPFASAWKRRSPKGKMNLKWFQKINKAFSHSFRYFTTLPFSKSQPKFIPSFYKLQLS